MLELNIDKLFIFARVDHAVLFSATRGNNYISIYASTERLSHRLLGSEDRFFFQLLPSRPEPLYPKALRMQLNVCAITALPPCIVTFTLRPRNNARHFEPLCQQVLRAACEHGIMVHSVVA